MLEKIDLNRTVDKETYQAAMKAAGEKLGFLQRECRSAGIPVILVFEGMGCSGKRHPDQPSDPEPGSKRL